MLVESPATFVVKLIPAVAASYLLIVLRLYCKTTVLDVPTETPIVETLLTAYTPFTYTLYLVLSLVVMYPDLSFDGIPDNTVTVHP